MGNGNQNQQFYFSMRKNISSRKFLLKLFECSSSPPAFTNCWVPFH